MDLLEHLAYQPSYSDFLLQLIILFGESEILIASAIGLIKIDIDNGICYLNIQ